MAMTIIPFISRWGFEEQPWPEFLLDCKQAGIRGIELGLPDCHDEAEHVIGLIQSHGFKFILQHYETSDSDFSQHAEQLCRRLTRLAHYQPLQINSHTGLDHFSVAQNSSLLIMAEQISRKSNITICHETHRRRFAYGAHRMAHYSELQPPLTLDISHWFCVAENYLDDQREAVAKILPWVKQLHLRIGHTQGSQIASLQGSYAKEAIRQHFAVWNQLAELHSDRNMILPATLEMGPPPYMPEVPAGKNKREWQFELNCQLLNIFKQSINATVT